MLRNILQLLAPHKSSVVAGFVIFASTYLIFLFSPVQQPADSNYSMLVSQSLIHHRTFALDHYRIPGLNATRNKYKYMSNSSVYQLELINNHVYYYHAPGSSVLAVPYVALMNALGVSAATPDGTYDPAGEIRIETGLASLLMATLAVVFFATSRLLLPVSWSAVIALGGALGTQVWSTATRALWFHTWAIFLLGIIVLMLVAQETNRRRLNPFVLASLLSWMYFVRPTSIIPILAITIYVLAFHRQLFIRYAATGAAWFGAFVVYSWHHFGQVLPNYYLLGSELNFDTFWVGLAGILVSPSRGLLVFVPSLLFVAYLLIRYRRNIQLMRPAALAGSAVVLHVVLMSTLSTWWGGFCYGPRYMTDIVPWFVLLAILGVRAMLASYDEEPVKNSGTAWKIQIAAGGALLAASVLINARGALSPATAMWNVIPASVDEHPERVWDWRRPQFLAK